MKQGHKQNPQKSLRQRRIEKSAEIGRMISQKEVAEYVGVSASIIGAWEHGMPIVKVDAVERLARFYGCTMDEIVGRKLPTSVAF